MNRWREPIVKSSHKITLTIVQEHRNIQHNKASSYDTCPNVACHGGCNQACWKESLPTKLMKSLEPRGIIILKK